MRRWIAALALLPATAPLPPAPARADGCGDVGRRIAEATGATIVRRTVGSDVYVHFSHPDALDFALQCRSPNPRKGPGVFVSYAGAAPPPAYFALAATAAAATLDLKPPVIRAAAQRCAAAARRDPEESATVETKVLRVECTVNKASGSATLMIASALMRPF
ncbi:hypothetical protein Q8W71_21175 [Methylobacterium sp. NEAU 140]|uniref:hypothetical protein n=1 Tax=Methylobacterium sp. NEAU 140 TaxID=3064945 RepID=UPI002736F18B|nr:hypothetical protein [Methylobacterium sp. NEAU 140]MDP4025147.1 hypothetical protein [Methylobacterium sp. NEAU 140]